MARTRLLLPLILLGSILAAGCAAPGARELTVAASNYEARSLEAIAAVDELARREIEVPARPEREAEDDFVQRMVQLPQGELTETAIVQALRPFDVNTDAATSERGDMLDQMREQHAAFTAIFADVERAGILAQRNVSDRVPPVLDVLIAQQVAMARTFSGDGRPRLLGLRGQLSADIHRTRLSNQTAEQKSAALRALRRRWLEMEAQEEQLLANTTGALLRAAAVGLALRRQVEDYGKLSLAQIQSIIGEALGFVGAATGRDLSALNAQAEALVAEINADPDFSAAAKALLSRTRIPAPPIAPVAGE